MKTGLITPVSNIDAEIADCKRHLDCEYNELNEAWATYHWSEYNKKNLAHVVEELVDLATACMTTAERLEKNNNIPELVNNALLMVASKNYIRGYHNKPMI